MEPPPLHDDKAISRATLPLTAAACCPFSSFVAGATLRILSDIHFGDRASQVDRLAQLEPLRSGVDCLVLNGDTLDTRRGPRPEHTAACRSELEAFAASGGGVSLLSGNHDPDVSPDCLLELAGGQVVVTHGDIFFDDIVPWGQDRHSIRKQIAAALAGHPHRGHVSLDDRFSIWRRVAANVPQRHQSERNPVKYALLFAVDTVWPPLRVFRILRAWRMAPRLAARFAREHWPGARFIVVGHTHRPGIWAVPQGPVVVNTGSFCPPAGGFAAEVSATALRVRRVRRSRGAFHPGEIVAEYRL